MLCSWLDIHSI